MNVERPLSQYSDEQLLTAWKEVAQAGGNLDLAMIQGELSRRTTEKAEKATQKAEEATRTLNSRIWFLTGVLVGLGVVQIVLIVVQTWPAVFAHAPTFEEIGLPSYYCTKPSAAGAFSGPCTAVAIFHNDGGAGSAIATFTSDSGIDCQAVIPSTPTGEDAQTSCVFRDLVQSVTLKSITH